MTEAESQPVEGSLLDEGLLRIVRGGGCVCDPPRSGREFCTGHCVLREEISVLEGRIERCNHAFGLIGDRYRDARIALEASEQKVAVLEANCATLQEQLEHAHD